MSEVGSVLRNWDAGRGGKVTLLAAALERALTNGELAGPLPAERKLAAALGVSRGTVAAAYARLKERRLLSSRPGSYTLPDSETLKAPLRAARLGARAMASGSILSDYVARDPGAIDLSFIVLDVPDGMREVVEDAYRSASLASPLMDYRAAGEPELREAIAGWYTRTLHLPTSADQIVVTQGAYQGIVLGTLLAIRPRDRVVLEIPSYPGALDIFRGQDAHLHMVDSFENAATLADLETNAESIGMVYATTVGRNPAGTIMAPRNAERLAHVAARHDLVTIDDRALEWCGFSREMPAPLAAYAPDAPILTLGSLDKTTGAGMRIGWIRAPRRFAHRLARLKALSDIATPTHVQRVAVRLVDRLGDIGEARRAVLRGRYEVLAGLLRSAFPAWRWAEPGGGLSIWVDTGSPAPPLVAAAAEAGVKLIAGAAFVPDAPDDTHLRIAFSQPEAALRRGVERLASIAAGRKLAYF